MGPDAGELLERRWLRAPLWALLALALVYYLPLPGETRDIAYAAITVPLIAAAAAASMYRARRSPEGEGDAWLVIGASSLTWFVGEASWTWIALVNGQELAFPHWTDGPYLLSTALLVVGVLMLAWRRGTRHSVVQALDAFLVTGVLFVIAWLLFLKQAVAGAGQTPVAIGITLAYPVGDAILVAACVLAFARLAPQRRQQLWPLIGGVVALAIADAGHSLLVLHEGGHGTAWFDLGWPAGAFGVGWAAMRPASPYAIRRGAANRFEEWAAMACVVPALLIVGFHVIRGGRLDGVATGVGLVAAACLLARQAFILNDHVRMSRELQEASRLAGLGTMRFDRQGFVLLDEGASRLLGLPQQPEPTMDAVAAALAPAEPAAFADVLRKMPDGTAMERTLRITAGGSARHLQMHAERASDGQLHATLLDVTAQVHLEEERQRTQAHRLEAQRLAELAKAKTKFINTAAHELNTPLTPIRLSLATLKKSNPGSQLALLERNVERLTQLLRDVLDGARLQADHLRMDRRPMDLAVLVREIVEEHGPAAEASELKLVLQDGPSLPVVGDARRLHEVLMNLLSNAMKFTPHGGAITVRVRADDANAVVEVSDTGRGIKEGDIALLFQPFTQVGDSQPSQGNGLGLYIARGIVEQHGGHLKVTSPGEGQGCTFTVTLPMVVQHVPAV